MARVWIAVLLVVCVTLACRSESSVHRAPADASRDLPAGGDVAAQRDWPRRRPAIVRGTVEQMARLPGAPGVNIDDHGERRLADGRWAVGAMIANDAARAEIERRGMEVEMLPPSRPPVVGADVPGFTAAGQAAAEGPKAASSTWTAWFLDEWMAKRQNAPGGYPMSDVHLVFEEWFDAGHVRVSVRGDGSYAIELDGPVRRSGPRYHPGRAGARGFYSGGKGAFPFLHHFGEFSMADYMMRTLGGGVPALKAFPPCPPTRDDGAGSYHASMTVTLEIHRVDVLRSWWSSPACPGFPRAMARDAWDLVERVAAGNVKRPTWHASPPSSSAQPAKADDR